MCTRKCPGSSSYYFSEINAGEMKTVWAMSTIRCKSFCQSVKGGINGLDIHLIKVDGISHGLEFFQEAELPTVCSGINDAL